jgi:hypothetical protein
MRLLNLLVVLLGVAAAGPALGGPLDEAATAYGRGDYATAFRLWRPLAEQGSAQAQVNLGRLYENGEGVAQDPAAAMAWYRKAAEQGVGAGVPATVTVLRGSSAPAHPQRAVTAPAPTATVYREIVYTPLYTPVYFLATSPRLSPHHRIPASVISPSSRAGTSPARR